MKKMPCSSLVLKSRLEVPASSGSFTHLHKARALCPSRHHLAARLIGRVRSLFALSEPNHLGSRHLSLNACNWQALPILLRQVAVDLVASPQDDVISCGLHYSIRCGNILRNFNVCVQAFLFTWNIDRVYK